MNINNQRLNKTYKTIPKDFLNLYGDKYSETQMVLLDKICSTTDIKKQIFNINSMNDLSPNILKVLNRDLLMDFIRHTYATNSWFLKKQANSNIIGKKVTLPNGTKGVVEYTSVDSIGKTICEIDVNGNLEVFSINELNSKNHIVKKANHFFDENHMQHKNYSQTKYEQQIESKLIDANNNHDFEEIAKYIIGLNKEDIETSSLWELYSMYAPYYLIEKYEKYIF